MRLLTSVSSLALLAAVSAIAVTPSAVAQEAGASNPDQAGRLDVVVVTAQRRAASVQDASLAISAFDGETLAEDRIMSLEDVANRVTSLSFTAISPLDTEFNIRGITNTRLDSPSADQSIGIFIDDIYAGRSGLFNFDLYDIERVEVVRGPQGVLMGRNVVGGAINVITAGPAFDPSSSLSMSFGNYDETVARGHVTGQIAGDFAGRLSAQSRNRSGYNYDILHNRDLDDLRSFQARAQLLWAPDDSPWQARLIADFTQDESNGGHQVAIDGPDAGQGAWSSAREAIGVILGRPLSVRESLPQHPLFFGDATETPQGLDREAFGITLQVDREIGDFATLSAVVGYRNGDADSLYDQTSIGPDNGYGVLSPLLFATPVNEFESATQFSQEVRLVSTPGEASFDWIIGAYHQQDDVHKYDRFWGIVPLAALDLISGESHWDNNSRNISYGMFGQLGYSFSDQLRAVAGVRYSYDEKSGDVLATAVSTGDRFNPGGTVPLTPLAGGLTQGQSFSAAYSDDWNEITPQVTVEYRPNDDLMFYATWSRGYKGGGFEDTPSNAIAATISYDPETVTNMEFGAKMDLLEGRARVNLAVFSMDYADLQVTQTDTNCLCNVTDNAADAEIRGIEVESQLLVTDGLRIFANATFLDTEYIDFSDSLGNVNDGNFLQRTPDYQYNVGFDYTTDLAGMSDALSFRVNYNYRGEMFWGPNNAQFEDPYGLLDARVAFTPNDGDWQIALWGRNLADTVYRTTVNYAINDEVSRLGAPQTFGIEFSIQR
ncbi:TonB-dependent receptor [Maricaulis salignorans]|uniref:TonB-dependent receptor n=1 Tax=Maricaulis salignorans TaxID=144026 RepID=UPI003A8FE910